MNKFGFRQKIEIELSLPTDEKEFILDFEMKFLDRNYQVKQFADLEAGITGAQDKEQQLGGEQKATSLAQASGDYECNLADVIVHLKKCGYPLENCFVSFWSPVFSAFINCGLDPLPQSIKLTKEDLLLANVLKPNGGSDESNDDQFKLHLKFLKGITSEYKGDDEAGAQVVSDIDLSDAGDNQIQRGRQQRKATAAHLQSSSQHAADKDNKRTKERTIGYIIEKVSQWRKLYNGYMDENHQLRRMSLEDAAEKVGVSKKSLDDYLSQLRQGR